MKDLNKWFFLFLSSIPLFFMLKRKEVIEYLKPGLSGNKKQMNRRDLQTAIFFVLLIFMIITEFLFQSVYSAGAWLAVGGLMGTHILKNGIIEKQDQ